MPIVIIPAAVLAIVLLMIYLAGGRLYSTPFEGIGAAGGTVGGLIARWFASGIQWAIDTALGDVRAGIRGVEGLMLWPAYWARTHVDAITGRLYQGYLVSRRIVTVTIPGAVNNALGIAHQWITAVAAEAQAEDQAILTWSQRQFTAVYADVAAQVGYAEHYALTLADGVQRYAAAGIAADAAYASGLYHNAITYTDALVHGLEGWTAGQIGILTGWTAGQIGTLEKYVASSAAAVESFAAARVATVETELGRLERECTDNLCSGVGALASLFNALAGDLGIAGLIALAAEAARDPRGTASVIDGAFGPVAREGASVMRAACGL